MGDRRNVVLNYGDGHPPVYLYSHNYGCVLPILVARALDANRNRWSDDAYLARFLVTHIVDQAEDTLSEYGWGLSPYPYITGDGHEDIVVNLTANTVTIKKTRSFEEFVGRHKDKEF